MVSGFPLTDPIRNLLLRNAQEMYQGKEKSRYIIERDECEGNIETEFKFFTLGHTHGIIFKAQIDTEKGRTTIDYIVRPGELDPSARWYTFKQDPDPRLN